MADLRFSFVSDKEVAEARENRVPLSTKIHAMWSRNVYNNGQGQGIMCSAILDKRTKNLFVYQVSKT